jgi:hypothetical protein
MQALQGNWTVKGIRYKGTGNFRRVIRAFEARLPDLAGTK